MIEEDRTSRAQNFRNFIDQLIDDYSTDPAINLIHGFQKDAIQNGWGHRISDRDWKMTFSYVENDCGKFIDVEDHGDSGLIGKNYTTDEIKVLQNQNKLPEEEKLARFSSLFNSGGNRNSSGLFGRGKLMYQAVSSNCLEYFDSLTTEGKYIANYVDLEDTNRKAFEEDEAKLYIKSKTGLDPKETTGTRIIIANPKSEVVDALKNGLLVDYINDTWWRIIEKYNARIEIYDNNELLYVAKKPEIYNYSDSTHAYVFHNIQLDDEYRIKNFGFMYSEDEMDERLANIAYYRKDMKIGNIMEFDSLGIDPKFRNKIAGFLEVDVDWEKKLEENENTTHYGPKSKQLKSYQKMKTQTIRFLNDFMERMGLKKREQRVDPNSDLKELASDLTDFLKDCNLDLDLSSINNNNGVRPLSVKCDKYYPNEGIRTVEHGQEMQIEYTINKIVLDNNFKVDIIFTSEDGVDKIYSTTDITINTNEYNSGIISIPFDAFFLNNRNLVKICVTSVTNANTKAFCTFPVFVDKDESNDSDDIIFRLNEIVLPQAPSRTIRYNEKIDKIELKVINNLNVDYKVGISGFIQDVNDRNNTIDTIYSNNDISIEKNSESLIVIRDVVFGEKFENKKGPMKIKFKLSHIEGLNLRKGEVLKEVFITVLYEEEQDNNTANLFDIHVAPLDNPKIKSKLEHNGDVYDLIFNDKYTMYRFVPDDKNDPFYKEYYIGEMLKTLLFIKLQNGDYSFIGCDEESIKNILPDELTKRTNDFVDSYISQYFEMRL